VLTLLHEHIASTLTYEPVERYLPPGMLVRIEGKTLRLRDWLALLHEDIFGGMATLRCGRQVYLELVPPLYRLCLDCDRLLRHKETTCFRCDGTNWAFLPPPGKEHAQQRTAGQAAALARWGTKAKGHTT
jgi:hypothetical protein